MIFSREFPFFDALWVSIKIELPLKRKLTKRNSGFSLVFFGGILSNR